MIQTQTKLTSQGQVSVPAPVRRLLGLTPGASIEWQEADDGRIIVRRAAAHDTLAAHRALFGDATPGAVATKSKRQQTKRQQAKRPTAKTLSELKQGIAQHIQARHARP